MYTTRHEFIKSLGISIASLVLNRCAPFQESSTVHKEKTSSYLSGGSSITPTVSSFNPISNPMQETTTATTEIETFQSRAVQGDEHLNPSTEAMEYSSFEDPALAANIRIRQCWEHLEWLVRHLYDPHWTEGDPRPMLIKCHATALNDMVATGELSQEGALEIHTAFGAAIDHILRTTLTMAC